MDFRSPASAGWETGMALTMILLHHYSSVNRPYNTLLFRFYVVLILVRSRLKLPFTISNRISPGSRFVVPESGEERGRVRKTLSVR